MTNLNILNTLEAFLYSSGGELAYVKALQALGIAEEDLVSLVSEYNNLKRGLCIVSDSKMLAIRVSAEYSAEIEDMISKKKQNHLSKAGMEVLSIILYKGEATAAEVDYIRGVNSAYTLRQLSIDGLLVKKRGSISKYAPSVQALSIIGITNLSALPHRDDILAKLDRFEKDSNVNY